MMSTSPFHYSAQFLAGIERTISRERLKRYLAATQQDMVKALELYEYNVVLSEILYGYLHGLEVAVRNAMHYALTHGIHNPRWYDQAPLSRYHRDKVREAKQKAGRNASSGKVIAELTFGFWTDLAARSYHWDLWVPHLNAAFPHARLPRSHIHRRLETVRWLRNRIAHHEPILTSRRRIYAGHRRHILLTELVECVEWICPETARWLTATSRYRQGESILAGVNAMGVIL